MTVSASVPIPSADGARTIVSASVSGGTGSLHISLDNHGCLWGIGRPDGSLSFGLASLLLSHGSQGPDTTVFLHFGDYPSGGQDGFQTLSPLQVDTSAYHTGTGCAHAVARVQTKDSAIGATIDWVLPQDIALDEFILARYSVYALREVLDVSNLTVGLLVQSDVKPSTSLGEIQWRLTNHADFDVPHEIAWAAGVDTLGHVPSGGNTATRFRAGLAAGSQALGAYAGNSDQDLDSETGPTDGFLYGLLQHAEGFELATAGDTDVYYVLTLDRDRTIAVGETLNYTVAFISDTLSLSSFLAASDQTITLRTTLCMPCSCPCKYDPSCDVIVSDVLDVVAAIAVAFRNEAETPIGNCPRTASDVDANGLTDVTDVVRVVNVAFRNQSVAANYVDPCE